MKKWIWYIAIAMLAIYILSPWDLYPLLMDDLVALAVLLGLIIRIILKQKNTIKEDQQTKTKPNAENEINILNKAFATLQVSPDASYKEIKAAYKKRLKENDPNKHDGTMEEHAKEMTRMIEEDYRIICIAKGYEM